MTDPYQYWNVLPWHAHASRPDNTCYHIMLHHSQQPLLRRKV